MHNFIHSYTLTTADQRLVAR